METARGGQGAAGPGSLTGPAGADGDSDVHLEPGRAGVAEDLQRPLDGELLDVVRRRPAPDEDAVVADLDGEAVDPAPGAAGDLALDALGELVVPSMLGDVNGHSSLRGCVSVRPRPRPA